MLNYILRQTLMMIPTLIVISIIAFAIIQLPPGDFLSTYVSQLTASGADVDDATIQALNRRYGLDQPIYVQYIKWVTGMLRGDFGQSFEWNRPVNTLIWSRLGLTVLVSSVTLIVTWLIAFPIGVYSATHQYSIGDYLATFFAFVGVAIPNFMLALVLMWIAFSVFGQSVGGLFSPEFIDAPWSWARVWDMLKRRILVR